MIFIGVLHGVIMLAISDMNHAYHIIKIIRGAVATMMMIAQNQHLVGIRVVTDD